MRFVHGVAFVVGMLGVQACGTEDTTPPPFESSGRRGPASSSDDELSSGEYGVPEDEELEPSRGNDLPAAPCSVTFDKQILPKIQQVWRCGASACHGGAGAHPPLMDTTDADKTYALFTTYVHQGKKLVDTKSTTPSASSLDCLMTGTCGEPGPRAPLRMPYQGVSDSDLAMVKSWLECGGSR
jgi:hypothetical protein